MAKEEILPLQPEFSYTGTVKKITFNVKALPHTRQGYKEKYIHNLLTEVNGKNYQLQNFTNFPDNANCKEGEEINFQVTNYHAGNNNYNISLLPSQVSKESINDLPKVDGRTMITGSIAHAALTLAVTHLQYNTDAPLEIVFAHADAMFAWMCTRAKVEGFM